MLHYIFLFLILFLLYTWVFYYLFLYVFFLIFKIIKNKRKADILSFELPKVTIIVAAYNEEKVIKARVENLLNLDYPRDNLEIIIASDGSTDKTAEIVEGFEGEGVRVVRFKKRLGKANIHNKIIPSSKGEIILLTDAETLFKSNFVQAMCKKFKDDKVGCVVGMLKYRDLEGPIAYSENIYWELESRLLNIESYFGVLANASGASMAFRKNIYKPICSNEDTDTATPIDIVIQGYKVVYAKDALAYEKAPSSVRNEFNARKRGAAQTTVCLFNRINIRGLVKHPFLVLSLLSHRFFRYITFYILLILLVINIFIFDLAIFYKLTLVVQILFYSLALIGYIAGRSNRRVPLASLASSFVIAMIGMMVGVTKGILGKSPSSYEPIR